MGNANTLQSIVGILNIVSVLEPPVVAAIYSLVQKMQGKTTEEILASADQNWADVAAAAQAELDKLKSAPPIIPPPIDPGPVSA